MKNLKDKLIKGIQEPELGRHYVFTNLMGRLCWLKFKLLGRNCSCGKGLRVKGKLEIAGKGNVSLGDNVLFEGGAFGINSLCTYSPDARISIGSYTYLNGVRVSCYQKVKIGEFCIFAYSHISDSDFHAVKPARRDPEAPVDVEPVIIQDNVWVCLSALIFKGVTIGRNSVVGGGAVVTRDVPSNCVVAGNPAKVVRRFTKEEIEESEILLNRLREIQV